MNSPIVKKVRANGGGLHARLANVETRVKELCMKKRAPKIVDCEDWDADLTFITVTIDDAREKMNQLLILSNTCPVCSTPFETRNEMSRHVKTEHMKNSELKSSTTKNGKTSTGNGSGE